MIVRILLLFIALFTFGAQAQAIKESYAFAVLGEPRYAFNFNHFDYVNPAAPKGGQSDKQQQYAHNHLQRISFYSSLAAIRHAFTMNNKGRKHTLPLRRIRFLQP
ncbi:hypothetical protein PUR50_27315, partial [Enterobacter hormaechei subsp. steigerwaltii]|nr:hypothetical protein [Enterobacter hormaechei subsp. steigerwaltii]